MKTFQGIGVYSAIAIGKATKYVQKVTVRRTAIPPNEIQAELEKLKTARAAACAELTQIYQTALQEIGQEQAEIFEIHRMMLEDEDYNNTISRIIENEELCAAYAVAVTGERFAAQFSALEDKLLQARSADVEDVSNRLIRHLTAENTAIPIGTGGEKSILCADDFSPSETVMLDKNQVLAFVTVYGSRNSHTSILARSRNIPVVIGVGSEFLDSITIGELLIVDGHRGIVILSPDDTTLEQYQ